MPPYACEHFYILTKPLSEVQALGKGAHLPMLNDQDVHLYARGDVEGLLVDCFEPHAKGLPLDRPPADFSFDLLDEGWDHFMPMMDNALRRIPALERAEVRMLLNGPESFTLDSQFMLGESPDAPGLFLMGGQSDGGMDHRRRTNHGTKRSRHSSLFARDERSWRTRGPHPRGFGSPL